MKVGPQTVSFTTTTPRCLPSGALSRGWKRDLFCRFLAAPALGRVQDDFGAQHGPILNPFWNHVGHVLGHFWVLRWHLHFRCDFDRFLINFRPPETSKNIEKPMFFFNIFVFFCFIALETDSGQTFGRFGTLKSSQNRSQEAP